MNQNVETNPMMNIGYIDIAFRIVAFVLFLLPALIQIPSPLIVLVLLSVYPAVTAITRFDPIYFVLKMNSRETDQEVEYLLSNAKYNIRNKWRQLRSLRITVQPLRPVYTLQ